MVSGTAARLACLARAPASQPSIITDGVCGRLGRSVSGLGRPWITERSTAEYQQLAPAAARYRHRGYRIHIDDFGTGYSSLAHLGELPVDAIKIDRLFTRAIGTGAISASIVPQIFTLAGLLGAEVIVEGIETEAQACHLAVEHPDALGQGWFFGRPVPARDFIT